MTQHTAEDADRAERALDRLRERTVSVARRELREALRREAAADLTPAQRRTVREMAARIAAGVVSRPAAELDRAGAAGDREAVEDVRRLFVDDGEGTAATDRDIDESARGGVRSDGVADAASATGD